MKNTIKQILYIKKGSFNQSEYLKIEITNTKNLVKYSLNDSSKMFEVDDDKINLFIDKLLRTTNSWKEQYIDNSIIDGSVWQLIIIYKNNYKRNYYGENVFPDNFNNFNKLKKQLLK